MYAVILMVEAVVYRDRHFFTAVIPAAGAVDMARFFIRLVHFKEDHLQLFRIGDAKRDLPGSVRVGPQIILQLQIRKLPIKTVKSFLRCGIL